MRSRLAIVTATIDLERAHRFIASWLSLASHPVDLYVVRQTVQEDDWTFWTGITPDYPAAPHRLFVLDRQAILGVVPAFNRGLQRALEDGHQIVACLHDDLEIEEDGWDQTVVRLFKACPRAGLVGFGGAKGLGDADIYMTPYRPMQLVRKQFLSNMRHAEAHGIRCEVACPVACLDGFSQIGLANYWRAVPLLPAGAATPHRPAPTNLFSILEALGVIHHAYDAALGAFAKQLGYQVWFLPVKVHHHGGLTAVADPRYLDWALATAEEYDVTSDQMHRGDAALWHRSHRAVYELFRHQLPIWVS